MKKTPFFILLLLICCCSGLRAQSMGFVLPSDQSRAEIPFQFENGFILIDIVFNKSFPLKFIFDTGAEHTILTKRQITDLLGIPYGKSFQVVGSDLKTLLTAHLIRGMHLKANDLVAPTQDLLVLDEDYYHFENFTGTPIHGILGADFFKRYVVSINYDRGIITLSDPRKFSKPGRKYKETPIEINRNKPYLFSNIRLHNDSVVFTKLLIDTGASLSFLLTTNTHPDLRIPEKTIKGNIGTGLGGELEGFLGRIKELELGQFSFRNVITNFHELDPEVDMGKLQGRNGIIGNSILSRFTMIIDYPKEILYLKPSRHFKEKFNYDKSGLSIIATGATLHNYIVQSVVPGSPADKAGIQKGDIIKKIGIFPASFYSLQTITKKFQKKEGKKIRLLIQRNEKKTVKRFRLKSLI